MSGKVRFPGEYEPHLGTLMVWPERPGSWGKDNSGAEKAFGKLRTCLGIEKLEAELILIDPKTKPDKANEQKIKEFCETLNRNKA